MAIRTEVFKKDLPVALNDEEVRQKSLQHIELLNDIDKLEEQKKAQVKEINETIKEKKKSAKKLAKVVVDKIEHRPCDVKEVADWETKRVLTMRRSSVTNEFDICIDARGMTLEEQQTQIPGTEAPSPKAEVDVTPAKKLSDKYRIELVEAGEKPLDVIKAVKVLCSVNLGAAKSKVAQVPVVVHETLNRGEAEAGVRALEKAGATVTLHPPEVDAEGNPVQKALPPPKEPEIRKGGKKGAKDEEPVEASAPATKEQVDELAKKFRKGMGADDRKPKDRRARG